MGKLLIVIITIFTCSLLYAHVIFQSKSYTFHRFEHVIDVELDQNNTLVVIMDTVEIGTRTNFCTPIKQTH